MSARVKAFGNRHRGDRDFSNFISRGCMPWALVNEQWQNIQNRAQELTKLAEFNTNAALEAELGNDWQMQPYAWLPLKANNQDMVVLVNPEQADSFKIISLRPW